jgi:hypothetical protein
VEIPLYGQHGVLVYPQLAESNRGPRSACSESNARRKSIHNSVIVENARENQNVTKINQELLSVNLLLVNLSSFVNNTSRCEEKPAIQFYITTAYIRTSE